MPAKAAVRRGPEPNTLTVAWEGDRQAVVDVLVGTKQIKVAIREFAQPFCVSTMMSAPQRSAVVQLDAPVDKPLVHVIERVGDGWSRRYDSTRPPAQLPSLGVTLLELDPTASIIGKQQCLISYALDGVPTGRAASALAAAFDLTWGAEPRDGLHAELTVTGGRFPEIQVTVLGPLGTVSEARESDAITEAVIAAAELVTAADQ